MAVPIEVWARDVQNNIYPDNSFYKGNARDDSKSQKGKKVHVIQAGSVPAVVTNPTYTGAAATASLRADSDAEYDVDEHRFGPVTIPVTEQGFASYDKRESVMYDTYGSLETAVADWMAYRWSPTAAANFVRTTGDIRDPLAAGQTAQRKAATFKDFMALQLKMNQHDIPQANRKALLCAESLYELQQIPEFMDYEKLGYVQKLKEGIKGSIAGFELYVRSRTVRYSNAATPVKKLPTAANAGTDNLSILAWHPDYVRYSLGSAGNSGIDVFYNPRQAAHFGDLLSGQVFAGGRIGRTDEKGVYVLIEAQ
jgi:hypothetical protein